MNAFCASQGEYLHSNSEFINLARFLRRTSETRLPTQSQFVWLYKLGPSNTLNTLQLRQPPPSNIRDEECDCNEIIFMTGYPSATWLVSLGAHYRIDLEFYYFHLSFLSDSPIPGANLTQKAPPPLLPSSQRRILQLRYVSIGNRENSHSVIETEQQIANKVMQKYLRSLKKQEGNWREEDSIVRSFSVHGAGRFSIEQAMTIYITRSPANPKFWTVIVWLDSGRDLSESPSGPWSNGPGRSTSSSFRHISIYRPGIAFQNRKVPESGKGDKNTSSQSARLLPRAYGESLSKREMSTDPFYALKEVFEFVVASELQMLEVIEDDLNTLLRDPMGYRSGVWSFTSLRYYHHILEQHINQNTETLLFIKNRHKLEWPSSQSDIALLSENQLKMDYGYLLRKGRGLCRKCDEAINHVAFNVQQPASIESVQGPSFCLIGICLLGILIACSLASKYILSPGAARLL